MSVEFNSTLGEISGNYLNLGASDDDLRNKSKYGRGSPNSVKSWSGAAAVCLGLLCLLLLAGIIGLVVHYANVKGHHDGERQDIQSKYKNLTDEWDQLQSSYSSLSRERHTLRQERDQMRISISNLTQENQRLQSQYNTMTKDRDRLQSSYSSLTKERDTLRKERDQMKTSIRNLTQENQQLQSRYDTAAASRDELQEEVHRLSLNFTEKLCRQGWIKFHNSCYHVSTSDKTWHKSRQDCQDRGADLVIINSREEQKFITKFHERTWIGLSDKHSEGTWKWVDGTDLVGGGFWQPGEPNDEDGGEDCVEVARQADGWNDLPCRESLAWACEE